MKFTRFLNEEQRVLLDLCDRKIWD